ncbi:MAG: hypothetical protein SPL79_00015 [Sphaerochaetaceae bacterium]|jgi:hypothetical protein|nr:hypothetical protein [Spirochaetaceae bacterium]MDY6342662.1 hypothetical protein [Sphaerochaetaceae bacterium]
MSLLDRFTQKHLGMNLKNYEKTVPSLRNSVDFDPVGHAKVEIRLPEDPYEPMTAFPRGQLKQEVFDYLDRRNAAIPSLYQINLTIHGHYTNEEQKRLTMLIKRHYDLQLLMKQDVYNFLAFKSLALFLLGVCVILLMKIIPLFDGSLLQQVVSTVGSFALWEAADTLILERREVRHEMLDIAQYSLCHINFVED